MKSGKTQHEARAKIIKAMAHPSRLFIIEELSKHECCVNELTEMIGADTSTVSKHLSVLKNAGLVTDEKRGKFYFLQFALPLHHGFYRLCGGCFIGQRQRTCKNLKCCK